MLLPVIFDNILDAVEFNLRCTDSVSFQHSQHLTIQSCPSGIHSEHVQLHAKKACITAVERSGNVILYRTGNLLIALDLSRNAIRDEQLYFFVQKKDFILER